MLHSEECWGWHTRCSPREDLVCCTSLPRFCPDNLFLLSAAIPREKGWRGLRTCVWGGGLIKEWCLPCPTLALHCWIAFVLSLDLPFEGELLINCRLPDKSSQTVPAPG